MSARRERRLAREAARQARLHVEASRAMDEDRILELEERERAIRIKNCCRGKRRRR